MHNFYFENNGPIEKFLEISKDFSHNRCIEKPSEWIFLIFCIFRLKSSLLSKTSNFDFEIFDLGLNIFWGHEIFKKMKTFLSFLRAPSGGQLLHV